MEQFLQILYSAEQNLQKANKDLKQLQSLDVDSLFKERIIPVAKRYQEIEEAILVKKETLLKLLIEAALASGKKVFRECCWERYTCEISPSEIIVSGGDWKGIGVVNGCGKYSLRQFMAHRELQHLSFIDQHLLPHLTRFLKDNPQAQESMIHRIEQIVNKCSTLSIPA